jgi:hypothetical protein
MQNYKGVTSDKHDSQQIGLDNSLLDICADVEQSLLEKYSVKINNAILAENKPLPFYVEPLAHYLCLFIAGRQLKTASVSAMNDAGPIPDGIYRHHRQSILSNGNLRRSHMQARTQSGRELCRCRPEQDCSSDRKLRRFGNR